MGVGLIVYSRRPAEPLAGEDWFPRTRLIRREWEDGIAEVTTRRQLGLRG